MSGRIHEIVTVFSADWPDASLDVKPGDLSRFAPIGLGLAPPLVVFPWDNVEDVVRRPNFYGAQAATHDPFRDAPLNDAAAGTVYFDGTPDRGDVESLLRLLGVRVSMYDYAVFVQDSGNALKERYLTQLRIIRRWGLQSMFGVPSDMAEALPPQPVSIGDLIWAFVEDQQETWGTGMGSRKLDGVMGGDGDWAKESLAFGFMVENGYHCVYRIWSRAWLVTK